MEQVIFGEPFLRFYSLIMAYSFQSNSGISAKTIAAHHSSQRTVDQSTHAIGIHNNSGWPLEAETSKLRLHILYTYASLTNVLIDTFIRLFPHRFGTPTRKIRHWKIRRTSRWSTAFTPLQWWVESVGVRTKCTTLPAVPSS